MSTITKRIELESLPVVEMKYYTGPAGFWESRHGFLDMRIISPESEADFLMRYKLPENIGYCQADRKIIDSLQNEVVRYLKVVANRNDISELEEQLFHAVSVITARPAVFEEYRAKREDKETKQLAIDYQAAAIQLRAFEEEAFYRLATAASAGLEYALHRDSIKRMVRSRFEPNIENSMYRPWATSIPLEKKTWDTNENKGQWARFLKRILGEGIYNKIANAEADIDRFYSEMSTALQTRLKHGEKFSEKMYKTFFQAGSSEDAIRIFQQECDATLEVLEHFKHFQDVLEAEVSDYTSLLQAAIEQLGFTKLLLTTTTPGTPEFSREIMMMDKQNTTEFFREFYQTKSELADYIATYYCRLRCPLGGDQPTKGPAIQMTETQTTCCQQPILPGSYTENVKSLYKKGKKGKRVTFTFSHNTEPNWQVLAGPNFQRAGTLAQKYQPINNSRADILLKEALLRVFPSEDHNKKQAALVAIEMAEFHPYLADEITWTKRYKEMIEKRFGTFPRVQPSEPIDEPEEPAEPKGEFLVN